MDGIFICNNANRDIPRRYIYLVYATNALQCLTRSNPGTFKFQQNNILSERNAPKCQYSVMLALPPICSAMSRLGQKKWASTQAGHRTRCTRLSLPLARSSPGKVWPWAGLPGDNITSTYPRKVVSTLFDGNK